jgi:hypothetical protein
MLMEINRKRDEDRLKAARMERLNLKRKEWEIQSFCNYIMKELVDEIVGIRSWMTEIARVMEVEWLKEVASSMMEYKGFTVIKEDGQV